MRRVGKYKMILLLLVYINNLQKSCGAIYINFKYNMLNVHLHTCTFDLVSGNTFYCSCVSIFVCVQKESVHICIHFFMEIKK